MPAFRPTYSSPYARLVANVTELGECWVGTERSTGRGGYVQVNFRVPGLGWRIVKFSAHILTWVAHETGAQTLDELYLAYQEFRHSGLVLDHTCVEPACRRPQHLEAVTQSVNVQRGHDRRAARLPMPQPHEVEF